MDGDDASGHAFVLQGGVNWPLGPHTRGVPAEYGDAAGFTLSKALEPECIALSQDETKAFVVMQENNAVAVVSLTGDAPKVNGKPDVATAWWCAVCTLCF